MCLGHALNRRRVHEHRRLPALHRTDAALRRMWWSLAASVYRFSSEDIAHSCSNGAARISRAATAFTSISRSASARGAGEPGILRRLRAQQLRRKPSATTPKTTAAYPLEETFTPVLRRAPDVGCAPIHLRGGLPRGFHAHRTDPRRRWSKARRNWTSGNRAHHRQADDTARTTRLSASARKFSADEVRRSANFRRRPAQGGRPFF